MTNYIDDYIKDTLIGLLEHDREAYFKYKNPVMQQRVKDLETCLYNRYYLVIPNPYENRECNRQQEFNF